MHRLSLKDLRDLGCVTLLEVRERERIAQAQSTIETLDRASERMLAAQQKLDDCPDTLRAT